MKSPFSAPFRVAEISEPFSAHHRLPLVPRSTDKRYIFMGKFQGIYKKALRFVCFCSRIDRRHFISFPVIQWHGGMNMILTLILLFLSLCAIGLVLWGICEGLLSWSPQCVYHIIPLEGNGPQVEQTLRSSLRSLKGRLYFVDCGLGAEGQMTAELLLRGRDSAILCSREQLPEYLRWENKIGSGTD